MIVTFSIHYRTTPGQQLCITGSTNGLGQWNVAQALRMHYTHDGHWTVQLNVAETEGVLEYKYLILDQQGHLTWEDGENRVISLSGQTRPRIYVAEAWRSPSNIEKSTPTAAFTKVIMQPGEASKAISHSMASKTLQFKMQVPRVSSNYKVCVLGNQAQLGHWDITRPFILGCGEDFPLWTGSIDASDMMQPIRYKYGIYDITKKRVVTLEEGIKLMPRIKDINKLIFFKPDGRARYTHINELFTEPANYKVIKSNLANMLRVAMSIKEGKVTASTIVRRLGPKLSLLCLQADLTGSVRHLYSLSLSYIRLPEHTDVIIRSVGLSA